MRISCFILTFFILARLALGEAVTVSKLDPKFGEAREKAFGPWSGTPQGKGYWKRNAVSMAPIYNEQGKLGGRDLFIFNPGIPYGVLGGLTGAQMLKADSEKIRAGYSLVSASAYAGQDGQPRYWALWVPNDRLDYVLAKMDELGVSRARITHPSGSRWLLRNSKIHPAP